MENLKQIKNQIEDLLKELINLSESGADPNSETVLYVKKQITDLQKQIPVSETISSILDFLKSDSATDLSLKNNLIKFFENATVLSERK